MVTFEKNDLKNMSEEKGDERGTFQIPNKALKESN